MNIHESAEDYLEQILMQLEQKGHARSTDIAIGLNVTKPSVSVAMKKLRENGYITMGADNMISLTDKGYAIARRIYSNTTCPRNPSRPSAARSKRTDSETAGFGADKTRISRNIRKTDLPQKRFFFGRSVYYEDPGRTPQNLKLTKLPVPVILSTVLNFSRKEAAEMSEMSVHAFVSVSARFARPLSM